MNSKIELKILTVEINPTISVLHISHLICHLLYMGIVYNEIFGSASVELYIIKIPSTEKIHNFDSIHIFEIFYNHGLHQPQKEVKQSIK